MCAFYVLDGLKCNVSTPLKIHLLFFYYIINIDGCMYVCIYVRMYGCMYVCKCMYLLSIYTLYSSVKLLKNPLVK